MDRADEVVELAAERNRPLWAGEVALLDCVGPATPLVADGSYAAEVDGDVAASMRFAVASRGSESEAAS